MVVVVDLLEAAVGRGIPAWWGSSHYDIVAYTTAQFVANSMGDLIGAKLLGA